ncbi:TRAP transporter small permease subunit, partial [Desulfobacterales bacterium HSG17]|nr:TRAP transporter small permease subunit [Desulfobacterales bacterium HSG17]
FIFGIMIVSGSQFAWFVRFQISPALSLPKWIIAGIIPVSGLVLLLHSLVFLMDEFKGVKNDT